MIWGPGAGLGIACTAACNERFSRWRAPTCASRSSRREGSGSGAGAGVAAGAGTGVAAGAGVGIGAGASAREEPARAETKARVRVTRARDRPLIREPPLVPWRQVCRLRDGPALRGTR
ncbi:MAG: hypothetical protein DMF78_13925 [Acidobacteria bacterium]|nr:MAG: hypothetical protein DMF78_13925 [Acidobacteriota bacterium]